MRWLEYNKETGSQVHDNYFDSATGIMKITRNRLVQLLVAWWISLTNFISSPVYAQDSAQDSAQALSKKPLTLDQIWAMSVWNKSIQQIYWMDPNQRTAFLDWLAHKDRNIARARFNQYSNLIAQNRLDDLWKESQVNKENKDTWYRTMYLIYLWKAILNPDALKTDADIMRLLPDVFKSLLRDADFNRALASINDSNNFERELFLLSTYLLSTNAIRNSNIENNRTIAMRQAFIEIAENLHKNNKIMQDKWLDEILRSMRKS
jgi:hypothetical protein